MSPTPTEACKYRRGPIVAVSPPRALAAWDDYLRIAGRGVLVPEARYNRAMCLIRLGRKSEARGALAAFANGEYGNYRKSEARALIDAIDRDWCGLSERPQVSRVQLHAALTAPMRGTT